MMRSKLLLLMTFLVVGLSYGQEDCKSELMTILHGMRNTEGMEKAHVKYVLSIYNGDASLSRDTVDIYTSPKKSRIVTAQSEIFQDETLIISLLNQEKMAYVMDPLSANSPLDQFQNGTLIQDSIIARAEVIECNTVCIDDKNNENLANYALKVDEAISDYFGYDKISFYTDPDRQLIKRIELKYQEGLSPSQVVIDILEYDTDYVHDIFGHRNPVDILASLNDRKNHYEVLDLRKNKIE